MNRESRLMATEHYLRNRRRHRLIAFSIFTLLAASVVLTRAGVLGQCGDDWSNYDHQTFRVTNIPTGDSIQIARSDGTTETIRLLGVASPAAQQWLRERTASRDVTLLLQSPQTRDAYGNLLAFAFIDHSNLSVDIVEAGMARADRRSQSVMDGLIRPAEKNAQKKKLGMWAPSQPSTELLQPISPNVPLR